MSSNVLIHARNLSKKYEIYDRPADRLKETLWRGRRKFHRDFWALRDVSFEVEKGSAVGIVGTNGSGKSTLLQMICGTLAPTSGELGVVGRISALLELGSGFDPDFTGRDNIYLNAAIIGLSREEINERYDDIVNFSGIGDFVDQKVSTYSSGMQMRLAFSVAVHVDPEILVVDEALAVGDNLFQKRCFERIEAMRAKGVTLLFVSHDQETVRTLTDKALLIDNGNQIMWGNSSEVVLEYRKLLHSKETASLAHEVAVARSEANAEVSVEKDTQDDDRKSAAFDFGTGDAEILSVTIHDAEGREANVFAPGETMTIRMRAIARKKLKNLNVGIRIRNKQGIKIYSWGTLNQDIAIWAGRSRGDIFWDREFDKDEEFSLELQCDCSLGIGFYEVQSYVSLERDRYFNAQRILSWKDEANFFSVTMPIREYFFGGICDMRMTATLTETDLSVRTIAQTTSNRGDVVQDAEKSIASADEGGR
ncbi:lipopolysaccharide transport system ATP-binding protein [Rhizobium sp. ERR 1071]|uniref:ABC transporter ATP-binding protein n=1 Tax=Rhizobium sp. ERR 1071 TaxID=2572677 RepID=UPI00119C10BD|nr:ABC transporter ATP-binding protein [Rhizobium sp. ERR1071]TWB11696.1 lipopolysaccharide transport system ATP-binding protein [Rhizobium sp. ERR1071]